MRKIYIYSIMLGLAFSPLLAQERRMGRKPVLIRADEEPPDTEEIRFHDPAQAKKSVSIGDFYYKRENYKAAEERFREAIDYNKNWHESYEKLIKTLEKMREWDPAIEVCQLFEENNPDSERIEKFQKKAGKLLKKKEKGD